MRLCNLNEIKEHGNGNAFMFEMNSDCHICFVIRSCPHVSSKAEGAIILLQGMLSNWLIILARLTLPVVSSQSADECAQKHS